MKKFLMIFFVAGLLVQGCSRETSDDLKRLGHDVKKDVNKAADKVDDKVHDALN